MNNKKQFVVQQGSNQTVKVFDAETGGLYRVINVGGDITSPPYVSGDSIAVGVKMGGKNFIKTFAMPHGGLKSSTPIG